MMNKVIIGFSVIALLFVTACEGIANPFFPAANDNGSITDKSVDNNIDDDKDKDKDKDKDDDKDKDNDKDKNKEEEEEEEEEKDEDKEDEDKEDPPLLVWSFTDKLEDMVKNYYMNEFPDVKIDYSSISSDAFEDDLDQALESGSGAPDIFALDSASVRKYIESGQLLDITDVYERNKDKLLKYPVEIGTYEGRVYAMSWQACPGAMIYRRSYAKLLLGTDNPATVQTYFTDLDTFLRTSELLKVRANGRCLIVSSGDDLYRVFLGSRSSPWIVNNKLTIDPNMEKYLDIRKIIHDNRYDARIDQWSDDWFAGMKDELKDNIGYSSYDFLYVFAYFLPTWGLDILELNLPGTADDWAMIPGPAPYSWGGTWIGANKETKNPEQVMEIIEYLTTNDDFLEAWARETGDIVSNTDVIDNIKNDFSKPFLGGQNHYEAFARIATNVDGTLVQGTDQVIDSLFLEEARAYRNGEKSKAQALADFKANVKSTLGFEY